MHLISEDPAERAEREEREAWQAAQKAARATDGDLDTDTTEPYFTVTELEILSTLVTTALRNGLVQVSRSRNLDPLTMRALDMLSRLGVKVKLAEINAKTGKGRLFHTPF